MNRLDEIQRGLRSALEPMGFEEVYVPAEDVYLPAVDLYVTRPHWLDFYLQIFGERGLVRKTFPDQAAREAFQTTAMHRQLVLFLLDLRGDADREPSLPAGTELEVLTIRVPAPVHRALKTEGHERRMSLNRLCLSKLLQPLGVRPIRRCRVCGCTDDRACEGGCYWVEEDLCSRCAGREEDGTCPDD